MLSRLLRPRMRCRMLRSLVSRSSSPLSIASVAALSSPLRPFRSSRRCYNSEINSANLKITKTTQPKVKSAYDSLKFGAEFSDHMLEIDWSEDDGWKDPVIRPYGPFSIDPSASVFHYALEAFEGLKAYRDGEDRIRLFRADKNWERFQRSFAALSFPAFNQGEVEKCLARLLTLEREWIPNVDGFSLYVRPTVISTHPYIGVAPSKEIKLFVILSPVGPYYPEGFAAVSLWATDKYVRAWPGGVGGNKLGSNYGPTIRPQMEAAKLGYSQVMWLFPERQERSGEVRHRVEEVGTMNMFMFWKNADTGKRELVTSPLSGTILPGVTRDSVLALTKEYGEFDVVERAFYMDEVVAAHKEERIIEAFGAGTAAIISPVKQIRYKDEEIYIPLDPKDPEEQAGPLAKRIWKDIADIQYGRKDHPWSVIVPE